MRNIVIEEYKRLSVIDHRVEVVERKGVGHPDTMCDSIMNQISVDLAKEYLKELGYIAHHNIDKSLWASGSAELAFGGGRITKPSLLIFGDRATREADGKVIDVDKIAISAAKKWLKENLRYLDPEKHVKYQVELRPGSASLTDIFKRQVSGEVLGANDTSAAVGYAPLTPTEKTVLETEKYINSSDFKKRFPESGEDVKVMGLRTNSDLLLTISIAFIGRHVKDEDDYFKKKAEVLEDISNFAKEKFGGNVTVNVNTADEKGRGLGGVYLSVTGTCAEDADSGQVGRGNRVNGLIPLNRPIGSEAAAGKNAVSHVGKIYNVLSHRIANRVYENVSGIKEIYIWLLSQIGKPIDYPAVAAAQVSTEPGIDIKYLEKEIREEIDAELAGIVNFCRDLALGKYSVC